MDDGIEAYGVLQVDSAAHQTVIHAAYRALARLYHPDGSSPDPARMATINRAYALVGTPECRRQYDANRQLRPTGPGFSWRAPYDPWTAAAMNVAGMRSGVAGGGAGIGGGVGGGVGRGGGGREAGAGGVGDTTLDFGRYRGWRLTDLARQDPDYLRWLCRQSAGVRYREQILRLLPNEPDLDRRGKSVA